MHSVVIFFIINAPWDIFGLVLLTFLGVRPNVHFMGTRGLPSGEGILSLAAQGLDRGAAPRTNIKQHKMPKGQNKEHLHNLKPAKRQL